jgi:cytochrome b561
LQGRLIMTTSARPEKYPGTLIALHWLTLLLIAAAYATMELRGLFERDSVPRELMKASHYVVGFTILALAVARIVAHVMVRTPPIVPAPPAWQMAAAHAVHLALYGLMIALPVLGWLILSAEGVPVSYLGLELPSLVGPDKPLAENLEDVHEAVATIGYGLIGLHAAAALYHHYVVRDNTLARMLPRRAEAGRS